MSKTNQFKEQVEELFYGVYNYYEDKKRKTVDFDITSGFDAESLFKLSNLLETGTIHSSSEGSTGGCPTCDGDLTTWISISATGVKFK